MTKQSLRLIFKKIAYQIIPPAFVELYLKYKYAKPVGFRGVYDKGDAELEDPTDWNNPTWLLQIRKELERIKNSTLSPKTFLPKPDDFLCFLLAAQSQTCKIKVLDFGGGAGEKYWNTVSEFGFQPIKNISWTVVDSPRLAALSKEIFGVRRNLSFYDDLPSKQEFDVLVCSSVLQYLDEPHDVLRKLLQLYNPKQIFLLRLSCGEANREYFTNHWVPLLNLYRRYHILNSNKILKNMKNNGYKLFYKDVNPNEYRTYKDYDPSIAKTDHVYSSVNMYFQRDDITPSKPSKTLPAKNLKQSYTMD